MSHNTDPGPRQLHEQVHPLPVGWQLVDVEHEQYEGPTFYPPEPLDAFGVAVLWTPEGYLYEVLNNKATNTLTRAELVGLQIAIDRALASGS
ncbi:MULTISPECIES: hypothetical protein [Kocuria]|jgi:hypothetical protein|uniref:hypothetical protein n=1 Tax=Kocuria TaxID=57493 RepID=UPI0020421AE5|nr:MULTISPECIES: hypothetical protein [Kocuria]MCM3687379.1 hypothetical protein [Kocuria rosea]HST73556.1 hypothetical protein [Kocuria rosea]